MSEWQPRIAFGIVAQLLMNLLLVLGVVWYTEYTEGNRPGSNWIGHALMGAVLGQIALVGSWLALGDGRWYWRMLIAMVLMMCLARSFGWAAEWGGNQENADDWARIAFLFIFVLLATCVLVLPLRRMRQWRLTWQNGIESTLAPQFQISDILLWMVPIGGFLAVMRFMGSLVDDGLSSLLDSLLPLAELAALTWCAMLAAFATRHRIAATFAVLLLALLLGVACAAPDVYADARRAQSVVRGPIAWQVYISNALPVLARHLLLALACAWSVWVNCALLRLLGCNFVRPGSMPRSPR